MIQYSSLDDAWGNNISKNNDSNKLNIAKEFNISTEKNNNPSQFDIVPNIAENSNFKESDIYNLGKPDTFYFESKGMEKPTKPTKTLSSIPIIKPDTRQGNSSQRTEFSNFSPNRNEMIQTRENFTSCYMDHISQCEYCKYKLKKLLKENDCIKIHVNDRQYNINRNILKIIFIFIIICIVILLISIVKDNKTKQSKYNYLPYPYDLHRQSF
jgi:hypothetical protein